MVSVDCIELSKVYQLPGSKKDFLLALIGVTFSLKSGDRLAIIGPSGSGKSTLLNIIGSFLTPSSGNIYIDNFDLSHFTNEKLKQFRQNVLGWVPQNPLKFFIWNKTVFFNISLNLRLQEIGYETIKRRVSSIVKDLDIKDLMDKKMGKLSGGEVQRVSIASALVKDPQLLLCDEPTGELDIDNANKVIEILKKHSFENGSTLIIVTHEKKIVQQSFNHLYLRSGSIQFSNIPDEFRGLKCRIETDGFIRLPSHITKNKNMSQKTFFLSLEDDLLRLVDKSDHILPRKSHEVFIDINGSFHLPKKIRYMLKDTHYLIIDKVKDNEIVFKPLIIDKAET